MKLVQNVLRTLDRTCHQLRVIEHVESQIPKVALRFLVAAIHLDGVAQRLKGMERQPNREKDREALDGIIPADEVRECRQVLIGKIEILKKRQHADVA
jgi:hypothetical protein